MVTGKNKSAQTEACEQCRGLRLSPRKISCLCPPSLSRNAPRSSPSVCVVSLTRGLGAVPDAAPLGRDARLDRQLVATGPRNRRPEMDCEEIVKKGARVMTVPLLSSEGAYRSSPGGHRLQSEVSHWSRESSSFGALYLQSWGLQRALSRGGGSIPTAALLVN